MDTGEVRTLTAFQAVMFTEERLSESRIAIKTLERFRQISAVVVFTNALGSEPHKDEQPSRNLGYRSKLMPALAGHSLNLNTLNTRWQRACHWHHLKYCIIFLILTAEFTIVCFKLKLKGGSSKAFIYWANWLIRALSQALPSVLSSIACSIETSHVRKIDLLSRNKRMCLLKVRHYTRPHDTCSEN